MKGNAIVNPAIRVRWITWIGIAAISSTTFSIAAHHSFAGEFDSTKKAQLVGTDLRRSSGSIRTPIYTST